MLFDAQYLKFHLPTHTNLSNYLIGILTGIIYVNMKSRGIQIRLSKVSFIEKCNIKHSNIFRFQKFIMLWYLILPLGVLNLLSASIFYHNDFKPNWWTALIGSFLRHSWGLLGLIFFIGICNGVGFLVKRIMCSRVFLPLGRLTYVVFICHTFIIKTTLGNLRGPMYLSDTGLVNYLKNLI